MPTQLVLTGDHVDVGVGTALRARVRDRLEQEYLRLRSMDRSGLPLAELEDRDARIAAIHDHLGILHERPGPEHLRGLLRGSRPRGRSPDSLITTVDVVDDDVVSDRSPLGRALIGARSGDRVRFDTPAGPRMARVLAVEI